VVVACQTDAPPSADTLLAASGGGAPPAGRHRRDNDYSIVSNGGEFTAPTYIAPNLFTDPLRAGAPGT